MEIWFLCLINSLNKNLGTFFPLTIDLNINLTVQERSWPKSLLESNENNTITFISFRFLPFSSAAPGKFFNSNTLFLQNLFPMFEICICVALTRTHTQQGAQVCRFECCCILVTEQNVAEKLEKKVEFFTKNLSLIFDKNLNPFFRHFDKNLNFVFLTKM